VQQMGAFQDAQAARLYAEAALQDAWGRSQATLIAAQGQARLDSAQAFAVTAGATLPWLALSVAGLAGLVLIGALAALAILALAALSARRDERLLLALARSYGCLPAPPASRPDLVIVERARDGDRYVA